MFVTSILATAEILMILPNNEEVPDPYYGNASDFEHVYQSIMNAMPEVVKKIEGKTISIK